MNPSPMLARLYAMNRRQALGVATIALALTAALDYWTPPEINVYPFYWLAVLIVSWSCGPGWAIAFTILTFFTQEAQALMQSNSKDYTAPVVVGTLNRIFAYALIVLLTTQLRKVYDREANTARIDDLTGVKNRKGLNEALDSEIARHRRNGKPFCVAYIDCDRFKTVNDRFGHRQGDLLLEATATVATISVRRSDVIGRVGGDEFVIVLPETDGPEGLAAMAKLEQSLRTAVRHHPWGATFSIGLALYRKMPDSPEEALEFADAAMYKAKMAGGDRIASAEFGVA